MTDYFREPKKLRTKPELVKSCRLLREHNEKLKDDIKRAKYEVGLWLDGEQTPLKALLHIREILMRTENSSIEKHGTG